MPDASTPAAIDFRALFAALPTPCAVLAPDLTVRAANDAFLRTVRMRPEEPVGRSLPDLYPPDLHPEDRGALRASLRRVLDGRRADPMAEIRCGERRWRPLNSPILDGDGAVAWILHSLEGAPAGADDAHRTMPVDPDGGFVVVDRDFRILEVGAGGVQPGERTAADLLGRIWWEVWPASAGTALEESCRRAMRDGVPVAFEHHDLGDGRDRWLSMQASPAGGGMIILFRDITAHKRTEAALRESEARFRHMADHAPVMMWMCDPSGRCTYLSRSWYAFTGQTPATGLGFGWLDALHPDDRESTERVFRDAIARQAPFRLDYRLLRQDGDWRWAIDAAAPRFDEDGRFLGHIGSVIDITERKAAETAQAVASERVERLQGLTAALSRARTPSDVAETAVLTGGRAAGSPRGTVARLVEQGRSFELIAAHGYSEADLRRWQRFANDGATPAAEVVARREPVVIGRRQDFIARYPGLAPWIEDSGFHGAAVFPLIASGERDAPVLGYIGFDFDQDRDFPPGDVAFLRTLADLCAQALDRAIAYSELERRVEERTSQLVQSQKMEAMGQLTGGIAHDFNNVLQGIGSCLAVLEPHVPDGGPRRLFDAAQQGILRGARLTQSLLAFARRQTLAPKPTDLGALLDGMRPLLEPTLGGLIRLGFDVAPGTAPALVDPAHLESALLNLVINARDAMPSGGSLTLRAANARVGRGDPRHPADLKPGDYVAVSVEDTGSGMEPAILARVFEPFYTTKEVGRGSGLGLSMVQGMAVQSGGGVAIASAAGRGTTVTLYLPRVAPVVPVAPAPPVPAAGAAPGEGRTVLLVDDDDLVRLGAEAVLNGLGYRVLAAPGGESALAILRDAAGASQAVDALVTDYAMPGMNGAVLAREARLLHPGLPVLLITGYADRPDGLEQAMLLQKPFRPAELAARLATLIGGGAAAGAAGHRPG